MCIQEGTDIGSTCFALCRKREANDLRHPSDVDVNSDLVHYSWEGVIAFRKKCTCPICKCNCNKRFKVNDMQLIGCQRAMLARVQSNVRPVSGEHQTRDFIQRILAGGAREANDIVTSNRYRSSIRDTDEVMYNLTCDSAAEAAIRYSDTNLSSDAIEAMQKGFGRSTQCILPNGSTFDTRQMTVNNNSHGNNNRLLGGSSGSANAIHSGMADNLNPLYVDMTNDFMAASNTNLAQQLLNIGTHPVSATATTTMITMTIFRWKCLMSLLIQMMLHKIGGLL